MTILEALSDPNLFGALPSFHDLKTWSAWQAFLAAVYGLPMAEAELEVFRAHTGRPRRGREDMAKLWRSSGGSLAKPGRGSARHLRGDPRSARAWPRGDVGDVDRPGPTLGSADALRLRGPVLRGCSDARACGRLRRPPTPSNSRTARRSPPTRADRQQFGESAPAWRFATNWPSSGRVRTCRRTSRCSALCGRRSR